MWTRSVVRGTTNRRARLKARKKKPSSKGKSLLFNKEQSSGSEESAAVHVVQPDLASFSDEAGESDNDPAVVRTVETLSVVGVMSRHHYRRRKSGLQEGSYPNER